MPRPFTLPTVPAVDPITVDVDAIVDAIVSSDRFESDDETLTVRLTREHDPDVSLTDYDYWGKSEAARHNYNGYAPRPSDMDGSARIVWRDRGQATWWQPPADVVNDPEALASLERLVRGWYGDEWTYEVWTVRVERGGVKCRASLGGLGSDTDGDYAREVVSGLVTDALNELAQG